MMMIYFRELRGDENTEIVVKDEVWKPVAVYAVVFAVAAAVVPKPAIEADRTVLETLISAEQFTDRLVSMLNIFRDSTSSEQFTGKMSNDPIYYAAASEPLRLKTSSFSSYDFTNDSWSIMKTDDDDPINSLDTTFRQLRIFRKRFFWRHRWTVNLRKSMGYRIFPRLILRFRRKRL